MNGRGASCCTRFGRVIAVGRGDLEDAFGHHVWATLRVIDGCTSLPPHQLERHISGAFGSIFETTRHIVGSDAWYLFVITGGRVPMIDEERMDLQEFRGVMVRNGAAWSSLLAERPDPDTDVVAHRSDGTEGHAPMGIRLAQVLHHGTDHRSQICTGFSAIGEQPPDIDVWAFGHEHGRVYDT
jgi:uncharacterized damage-inducible protein DinB